MVRKFKSEKEAYEYLKKKFEDEVVIETESEPEPEVLTIDTSDLVTVEPEKEEYFTCSVCGFDKVTKDMSECPKCKAKIEW